MVVIMWGNIRLYNEVKIYHKEIDVLEEQSGGRVSKKRDNNWLNFPVNKSSYI